MKTSEFEINLAIFELLHYLKKTVGNSTANWSQFHLKVGIF